MIRNRLLFTIINFITVLNFLIKLSLNFILRIINVKNFIEYIFIKKNIVNIFNAVNIIILNRINEILMCQKKSKLY